LRKIVGRTSMKSSRRERRAWEGLDGVRVFIWPAEYVWVLDDEDDDLVVVVAVAAVVVMSEQLRPTSDPNGE
jgi:hypothetical protein